ncbi:MAG TPA: class I SAM-dependent methyltransferase [Candidatus Polarisedimenticolia bacterium]|nr:class I SAM-dependent methyltransferase [Candidatus Polarisedimenticolia bacterium]
MGEAIDTSYEPFSREPEYLDLNREFIRALALEGDLSVLDLACGTATLTGMILEELGRRVRVVGVDLSRRSLLIARADLGEACRFGDPGARVTLVEASGDRPPARPGSFDLVVIGNAIHCFPDRDRLLAEIRRALRPGGRFAFNTSFYAGTFVPGTERFYEEWLKEAVKRIRARDQEERRAGRPGIPRTRGRGAVAFSRPWLSPRQYGEELERHGFRVTRVHERTVMMSRRAFETVGAYEGMAAVLLSGYPVALACEALTLSVPAGLRATGLTEVPRHWLEMEAVREEETPR